MVGRSLLALLLLSSLSIADPATTLLDGKFAVHSHNTAVLSKLPHTLKCIVCYQDSSLDEETASSHVVLSLQSDERISKFILYSTRPNQ